MPPLNLNAEEKAKLKSLIRSEQNRLHFLGYTVNLQTGEVDDRLDDSVYKQDTSQVLNLLLSHYSAASPKRRTGVLIKFRNLPSGPAYETTFIERVSTPIARVFGDQSHELVEAAKLLDGVALNYGDSSVEITALKGIPIVYILWEKNEFPASATTLFDESARHYLPTEDLAVLAELTTLRLEAAWDMLQKSRRKLESSTHISKEEDA